MGILPCLFDSARYCLRLQSMHSKTRWIRPSQLSTSFSLLIILPKTFSITNYFTIFGWSRERRTEISRRDVLGMPSQLSSILTFFIATTSPVMQSIALKLIITFWQTRYYTTPYAPSPIVSILRYLFSIFESNNET